MPKYHCRIIAIFYLLCSNLAIADGWKNSVGAGIQYGGIIGWQGAFTPNNNRLRLAIGYQGGTIGYDRFLTPNASLGVQGFVNQFRVGLALSANYYINTGNDARWVFGLDLYRGYDSGEAGLDLITEYFEYVFDTDNSLIDPEIETGVAVSFGYQF